MFNELMNTVVGPISDSLVIVPEAFARCNSEEEVVLLKKVVKWGVGKDKMEDLSIETYNSFCSRLEAKAK